MIRVTLPLPPSLNQMIDLAKKRTRRTRNGGFMKRALPVVYDQHLETYELLCTAAIREAGIRPPPQAWEQWKLVSIHFRVHNHRDWLELAAGAKWPIDFLVRAGFVAGDSPREMDRPDVWPTQEISRKNPGVIIEIAEVTTGGTE